MKTKWAILILFLAGLLAYGNTARNGLFWDDDEFITRNAYIRSFRYLPQWFSRPLTAGAGVNSNYYRPALQLSFAVDYKLWGLRPAGYHLENMLWHTAAAILLYFFLKELLLQFGRGSSFTALGSSLMWLVHPIHVEAVAYANSRGDSMATVFILLSLIFWLKKRYGWSTIAFVAALLSKEFAIVTPGLVVLTSFVNLTNGKFTKLPTAKLPAFVKETPRRTSRSLLIMFIIAAIYILLRLTVLNFQNTLNFYGADLQRPNLCTTTTQSLGLCSPLELYATSAKIRFLTFLKILPLYSKLLVWPNDLHMERTVDIPTSLFDPIILSVIGLFILIGLLVNWLLIIRKQPLPMFALSWFFISILPVSGLIPISQILAEHFLYLPSIGFFLIIGWLLTLGLNQVIRLITIKRLNDLNHLTFMHVTPWTILLIISIPLVSKTIRQNRVWRDPITFYEYTLSRTVPTVRIYNNLAMAYADAKNHDKAVDNYQKSIALGDVYPNPHYNLGNTYVEIGQMEKAEEEYKKALQINPNFHYATLKLGQLYLNTNRISEAKKLVCPIFPTQPLCL